jgi:hypothetical protein
LARHAHTLTSEPLVADVDFAGRVVADEDRRKARCHVHLGREEENLLGDLNLDFGGKGFAV